MNRKVAAAGLASTGLSLGGTFILLRSGVVLAAQWKQLPRLGFTMCRLRLFAL